MLFNSLDFALFLPVVFVLYWILKNKPLVYQNLLLLVASYLFYACWDWRFLFLLVFSTVLDYFSGLKIAAARTKAKKKTWLFISIGINLGLLVFFKYYNFFIDSFAEAMSILGVHFQPWTLSILLPVGISFYTFHGLSYIIDIYRERIGPEKNFIDYSVFVSFFPLLVAGPIERATHLLPQIKQQRIFDYNRAVNGLRQILWGLFKKMVIADNCAVFANRIFDGHAHYSGPTLLLGALFFTFQIYCDFSGYSDIALGTARLFGIELLRNFAFPYFSRDIAEFWRRWHISLSSWFRDYLYIPLGGSKGNTWNRIRNTFVIFLVSGFWHGANWTFLFWGLLNAIYFMPLLLMDRNRHHIEFSAKDNILPSWKESLQMLTTFGLTVFAWIFFRSNSLHDAFAYIHEMSVGILQHPGEFLLSTFWKEYAVLCSLVVVMMLIEWLGRNQQFAIATILDNWRRPFRWSFYLVLVVSIFYFMKTGQQFIYFQF